MKKFPAIVALLAVSGCAWMNPGPHIPEIGRDLPENPRAAKAMFSERLSEAFPAGTREEEMIAALREEGFMLVSGRYKKKPYKYLEYTLRDKQTACKREWRVDWKESARILKSITGMYDRYCQPKR